MGRVKHVTTNDYKATLIRYSDSFARLWYREGDQDCRIVQLHSPQAINEVAAQLERYR